MQNSRPQYYHESSSSSTSSQEIMRHTRESPSKKLKI